MVSRPRIDEQVPRRYYEQLGLISPKRAPNGYREYLDGDVSVVAEIRKLHALGIPPSKAYPFIDCLGAGHENADDCVTSLAVYRDSLIELNHMIASLTTRRDRIARRLTESASLQFFHRRPT